MGAREFGRLVDQRLRELEQAVPPFKQQTLAVAIGVLPDGTTWDSTRVRRLRTGRVRLEPVVVGRIIDALGLDPPKAWAAAGFKAPWMTEEDYRDSFAASGQAVGTNRKRSSGEGTSPAQRLRLVA